MIWGFLCAAYGSNYSQPFPNYNEWQESWHMLYFFNFFCKLSLPLCPISMFPGIHKMDTNFLQHCLERKGGPSSNKLKMNYKTSVYYVEWWVDSLLIRGGLPTTFATGCTCGLNIPRTELLWSITWSSHTLNSCVLYTFIDFPFRG